MRKVWDIHGGVHPEQHKQQSNQTAIEDAGIPELLVFPLSQHIGTPATAIVEVGQRVLKGQQIAAAKGFVSVPVHASTSGEVVAIESRLIPHPSGMSASCIVIKADGKDEWIDHMGYADYSRVDKAELLNSIREAGIAGMGGAGFPAAVKLNTRDDQLIETLIINGTECEPYITSDDRLMRERADEIIAGAKILRQIINPGKETLIGVEDNKPECIAALQLAAADSGIEIVSFPTKYPSGGEKQLIQILTGKEVPAGGLPAQVGIVCQNVGSCVAIYRAICKGEPLISRITTVTGFACGKQQNFEVLLGTPVAHLLKLCDYDESQCSRLIMGGPMMGFTLESDQVPVVKTTNCILAPTLQELPPPPPAQACIRCGLCAEACPVSLLPQQMYWFARGKEYDKLEAHNLMDCIECGACSFACPSNIPLVQYYRASKADIREQKADAIRAEHSKARFEARQQRIEKQDAEKEAKRRQRKADAEARAAGAANAAGNSDGKGDAIQAAIERAKAKKAAAQGETAPAVNAAQQAIARAQQQRANKAQLTPVQKAQQAVESLKSRIAKAEQKLTTARNENDDNLAIFETTLSNLQGKLAAAVQALSELDKNANQQTETVSAPAEQATNNAADDAIARALAKRQAASTMTDEQRLQNAIESLQKRLAKSRAKLSDAEASGDSNASILADSISKLEAKLADAQQAYNEYQQQN